MDEKLKFKILENAFNSDFTYFKQDEVARVIDILEMAGVKTEERSTYELESGETVIAYKFDKLGVYMALQDAGFSTVTALHICNVASGEFDEENPWHSKEFFLWISKNNDFINSYRNVRVKMKDGSRRYAWVRNADSEKPEWRLFPSDIKPSLLWSSAKYTTPEDEFDKIVGWREIELP